MRRPADFVTPIPKVRSKIKETVVEQGSLDFDDTDKLGSDDQQYTKDLINEIRHYVAEWRLKPKTQWRVTPETARLLDYWRNHKFEGIRPFFCQVEAVEVAIWLTEVAPQIPEGKNSSNILHASTRNSMMEFLVLRLSWLRAQAKQR